jgi:hypothetical protein
MKKIKHVGVSVNRLSREPREKAFAKAWNTQATCTLNNLLHPEGGLFLCEGFTQRDATVAATLIQWLGSPIGEFFINQVRESAVYRKKS